MLALHKKMEGNIFHLIQEKMVQGAIKMTNFVGQKLKGYQLLEEVDVGGFGAVYRAYQDSIQREVAIKAILPIHANKPDFIRRFEFEAQLVARLEHPHITPLYDYWRDPTGAYLVMRYLRGGSVRDKLKINSFDMEQLAQLMSQITSALDLAHRNDVIHRDIKPENFLLDEDGNIYLADFGIAKDLAAADSIDTETEAIVGTLFYISPEQLRGEMVTPRTDIYCLGVVLYELLTGNHPFKGSSFGEVAANHLHDPLPEIDILNDSIKESINTVIQKATAKEPDKRYENVLAFDEAFRNALNIKPQTELSIVEQLSLREHEILQLIADGLTNREIADNLFLTISTIKWHIKNIYPKLGVRSRVQAIIRARELDLIIPSNIDDAVVSIGDMLTSISEDDLQNPYKGLLAFQISDSADFYGRDELVQQLITRMKEENPLARFLSIIGPSGSGKSSVVKAGLIPALWKGAISGSENWFVAEMIPGAYPVSELAITLTRVAVNPDDDLKELLNRDEYGLLQAAESILPDDGSELLIFIDQFEEVFTQVENEATRSHFLNLIQTAIIEPNSRVRIVMTLRADYYDRPLHYPEFGRLVRSRSETVLSLRISELEQAIISPAQRIAVTFEAGLAAQIASEMHQQAGALPLMQYALMELFNHREGRLLTHDAYRKIGGAVGALATRADELYDDFTDEGRELARQIFLRLVILGEGSEDTRRRAFHSELESLTEDKDLLGEIIESFADYRLLSLDTQPGTQEPTVEVAHEAILQVWSRLHAWISDSRDELRTQRQVADEIKLWFESGKDESYLASGSKLIVYEEWAEETTLSLTQQERVFLEVCIERRVGLERQKAARKAHEEAQIQRELELEREAAISNRRARNNLQIFAGVLLIAVIGAIALAVLAFNNARIAEVESVAAIAARETSEAIAATSQAHANEAATQESIAITQQSIAEREADTRHSLSLAVEAQEILDENPLLALALAVEANQMFDPPQAAQNILFLATTSSPIRAMFKGYQEWNIDSIAYSPDGRYFVSGSRNGTLYLWDIATRERIWQTGSFMDTPLSMTFSPDGQYLAVGTKQDVILIETETAKRTPLSSDNSNYVRDIAFSPDGQYLAAATFREGILIWNIETGEIVNQFENQGIAYSVAYSPDGRNLLIGSNVEENNLVLWDIETGEMIRSYDGLNGTVQAIDFSPDGQWIVAGDDVNREAKLWHISESSIYNCLCRTFGADVTSISFSPDAQHIAIASDFPALSIWKISNGQIEFEQTPWKEQFNDFLGQPQVISYSPDGQHILAAGQNRAYIVDVSSAPILQSISTNLDNDDIGFEGIIKEFVSAEQNLVTTFGGQYNLLIDDESGELFHVIPPQDEQNTVVRDFRIGQEVEVLRIEELIEGFAIAPDKQSYAYSLSADGQVSSFDMNSGEMIRRFVRPSGDFGIGYLIFSPDGEYLLAGTRRGEVFLWDTETGDLLQRFRGHASEVTRVAFSPDGEIFASISSDLSMILWDIETGRMLHRLTSHRSAAQSLAFSPDGRYLLTANAEDGIFLWDVRSGLPVGRITTGYENRQILAATFSDDGNIISFDNIGDLTYWQFVPNDGDWLSWTMANRFVPEISCELREQYLIEPPCNAAGIVPANTPYPTPLASATAITIIENAIVPLNPPIVLPTLTPIATFDSSTIASISGFVRHNGEAVSDVTVTACGEWMNFQDCIGDKTDANGFYEITGIPRGIDTWIHINPEPDSYLANRNMDVGVLNGNISKDIELVAGYRFQGGFVLTESDCCEQFGLDVEVIEADYIYPDNEWLQIDVDNGQFDVVFPPGIYVLTLPENGGNQSYKLESFIVDLSEGDVIGVRIPVQVARLTAATTTLASPSPIIVASLTPRPTTDPNTIATVSGTITHNGEAVQGVRVGINWNGNGAEDFTDENGRYTVNNVPKGDWMQIFVRPEPSTHLVSRNWSIDPLQDDLVKDFDLIEGHRFQGSFFAFDGNTVGSFWLGVDIVESDFQLPDMEWLGDTVSEEGDFDLVLPSGLYEVSDPNLSGYSLPTTSVDLRDDDVMGVRIELEARGD